MASSCDTGGMIALLLACSGRLDDALPFEDQEPAGPWVWIHGEVPGMERGQVRFLEPGPAGELVPVCAYSVTDGRFEARGPLNNPQPVWVLATAREGGSWTALESPVQVGDQALSVLLHEGQHPAWALGLQPAPERPLDASDLMRTGL